jgi:hypothetical protein
MKRQFRIKTTEDAVVCMNSSKTRAIVPCKISISAQIEEDCAWGPRSRRVPTAAAQIFDLKQTNQSSCVKSVQRIRDVYAGSDFFHPGSRFKSYYYLKCVLGPKDNFHKSTGSLISDPDPQQNILLFF